MRHRWAAQIALVVMFCAIGALFVLLPRILRSPPRRHTPGLSLSGTFPTTVEIRNALSAVDDPELGINIVDLGLVRDVRIEKDGKVSVTLLFTSPLCPLSSLIINEVSATLSALDGVREVEVRVDRSSVWSPQMMSDEARDKLKGYFR
jgi:metal-sulfur cluster biosynthetic enzyme